MVSWAIIVTALAYADTATGTKTMHVVHILAMSLFAFAVLFQGMSIWVSDPNDWRVPSVYHWVSYIVQGIIGIILMSVAFLPYFVLDNILADLTSARCAQAAKS
jgi:hypothetical protein